MGEQGQIREIGVDELGALHGDVVIVDVRMPDEYAEAHVPGAILVPLPELAERAGDLPDADTLYMICRSGARSLKACELLVGSGRDAVNIAGGTMAWLEAGKPATTGSEPG